MKNPRPLKGRKRRKEEPPAPKGEEEKRGRTPGP